jgi:hypothetical protein
LVDLHVSTIDLPVSTIDFHALTSLLTGFAFINELDPPEKSDVRIEVCRCMTVERFKEGDVICKQGEKGDCMCLLRSTDIIMSSSSFNLPLVLGLV